MSLWSSSSSLLSSSLFDYFHRPPPAPTSNIIRGVWAPPLNDTPGDMCTTRFGQKGIGGLSLLSSIYKPTKRLFDATTPEPFLQQQEVINWLKRIKQLLKKQTPLPNDCIRLVIEYGYSTLQMLPQMVRTGNELYNKEEFCVTHLKSYHQAVATNQPARSKRIAKHCLLHGCNKPSRGERVPCSGCGIVVVEPDYHKNLRKGLRSSEKVYCKTCAKEYGLYYHSETAKWVKRKPQIRGKPLEPK